MHGAVASFLAALALAALLDLAPAEASWRGGFGPYGGDRKAVVVDPHDSSLLYTDSADEAGVWTSRDAGGGWQSTALTFGDSVVAVLDLGDRSRVVAGLSGRAAGLFWSEDAGATWTAVAELQGQDVLLLAADPYRGDHCLAVVRPSATEPHDFFRTTDGGATWQALDPGVETVIGEPFTNGDVAFDPDQPDLLYLAVNAYPFKVS
ncbi:MAG: hypothetical protein AB1634_16125 [Thermodesulfobacteriota bacterium]